MAQARFGAEVAKAGARKCEEGMPVNTDPTPVRVAFRVFLASLAFKLAL